MAFVPAAKIQSKLSVWKPFLGRAFAVLARKRWKIAKPLDACISTCPRGLRVGSYVREHAPWQSQSALCPGRDYKTGEKRNQRSLTWWSNYPWRLPSIIVYPKTCARRVRLDNAS